MIVALVSLAFALPPQGDLRPPFHWPGTHRGGSMFCQYEQTFWFTGRRCYFHQQARRGIR